MAGKKKEEKQELDDILASLEKKYGVHKAEIQDLIVVSTGSLQLDQATGIGGTAVGKIIELFGQESSGKTTLTLHQMAEYQKAFPLRRVAYFDYEHSFDKKYATTIGVDVNRLLIYQPESMEDGYDLLLALVEKELISCAVIDSQTAAMPKAVLQGEMGDSTISLQARLNSKFCMKVKGILDVHRCTLFIVSQLRDKIGSMGEPTTTTGGNAIKFYSDFRWKVWKMNDKQNEQNKTTVDVIKNKLAAPFGQAKFNILWKYGIDRIGELLDYAIEFGMIVKSGSWLAYGETKVQGENAMKEWLEENSEDLLLLEKCIMNRLNGAEALREAKQEIPTNLAAYPLTPEECIKPNEHENTQ